MSGAFNKGFNDGFNDESLWDEPKTGGVPDKAILDSDGNALVDSSGNYLVTE